MLLGTNMIMARLILLATKCRKQAKKQTYILILGPFVRKIKLWSFVCCRLWVMTVNALQPSAKPLRQQSYTQNDLMVDPLIVLRCDQRVYR